MLGKEDERWSRVTGMHPRSYLRWLLGLAALVLVYATPGIGAAASREPIVADELPEGPPPTYSYADWQTLWVPRYGELGLPEGSYPGQVYKAHSGWLSKVAVGNDESLVLLQADGTQLTVVPPRPVLVDISVSTDGRLVVVRSAMRRVEAFRVSDGARIAQLKLAQTVYPLAMRPGRVLVAREPTPAYPEQYSLAWWDVAGERKGSLRTVFRARRWGNFSLNRIAVDLSAGQFVQPLPRANVVRPLEGSGPRWEVSPEEAVGWSLSSGWSPDDRLVLSVTGPETNNYAFEVLRVRHHRTGKVVARFDGLFEDPAWETNDTVLLGAYSYLVPGAEGGSDPDGRETIRCRMSTETCEKVLPSDQLVWFVARLGT